MKFSMSHSLVFGVHIRKFLKIFKLKATFLKIINIVINKKNSKTKGGVQLVCIQASHPVHKLNEDYYRIN